MVPLRQTPVRADCHPTTRCPDCARESCAKPPLSYEHSCPGVLEHKCEPLLRIERIEGHVGATLISRCPAPRQPCPPNDPRTGRQGSGPILRWRKACASRLAFVEFTIAECGGSIHHGCLLWWSVSSRLFKKIDQSAVARNRRLERVEVLQHELRFGGSDKQVVADRRIWPCGRLFEDVAQVVRRAPDLSSA